MANDFKDLKKGDILVSHYSYNRDLYTFYVVTRVTEKSFWFIELEKSYSTKKWQPQWTVLPKNKIRSGEKERMKRKSSWGMLDNYSTLTLWNGKPMVETSD